MDFPDAVAIVVPCPFAGAVANGLVRAPCLRDCSLGAGLIRIDGCIALRGHFDERQQARTIRIRYDFDRDGPRGAPDHARDRRAARCQTSLVPAFCSLAGAAGRRDRRGGCLSRPRSGTSRRLRRAGRATTPRGETRSRTAPGTRWRKSSNLLRDKLNCSAKLFVLSPRRNPRKIRTS